MKRNILTTTLIMTLGMASLGNPEVCQGQNDTSYRDQSSGTHLKPDSFRNNKDAFPDDQPISQVKVADELPKSLTKNIPVSGQKTIHSKCKPNSPGTIKIDKYYLSKELIALFHTLNKEEFDQQRGCSEETANPNDHPSLFGSYYPGLLNEKIL
jgi:hypothetical protein